MRRVFLLAAAVLALAVVLKESREPHLWLYLSDLLWPPPAPVDVPLASGLAGRLYTDTRPHTGKIARLQKGIALLDGDQLLAEEGFGFGLPLVDAEGRAYLARTATVSGGGGQWVKRYVLDTIDTPSGFMRQKYVPVEPLGTVVVTYTIRGGTVDVEADLTGIARPWERAYLMNEQGASHFTRYEEPGLVAEGAALGQWHETNAPAGCLAAPGKGLRFCVETAVPVRKFYGRERYLQYYWVGVYGLSWAGLDLEVPPGTARLRYSVTVERGQP